MSVNLMDMVKGAVSQQMMGKLGGLLGTDEKKTSSAFETAAGSILGGLMKKGKTSQGAGEIFDMVKKQDDSVLDRLDDLLGGGNATDEYKKQGSGILDGVLGSNRGGILKTLAKFLGFDDGMMGSMMSMIAPIIMGVIGRHVKGKALDAVGLGNLLGEQKSHMGGWGMPASLTGDLGFGDLMGNVTDAGKAAVGAVGDAGRATAGAVGDAGRAVTGAAGEAAEAGGGLLKILLPLIIIGGLIWAAITFLPGLLGQGADAVKDGTEAIGDAVGGLSMPKIEIPDGTDFGGFDHSALTEKFTGITAGFKDVNSDNAQGLADKISGLTDSLDGMGIADIPEGGKGIVGKMFGGFTDTITKAMGGIKDDGILGILKPVVEALMEKIKGFGF